MVFLMARHAAAALALLFVAGCASRPEGMLQVAEAPPGTDRVDMLTATTRDPSAEPGVLFGGGRGQGVSFANIVVSIPKNRDVGTVQWPRRLPPDPRRDFVATQIQALGPGQLKGWFNRTGGKARRVFIFVHGFNTRFDTAVFRFAQLAHDTDAKAAPVLFSWPSRGRLLDYNRDRENATYSRSDLAGLLEMAASSPAVSEVTVLAHSMGAWVTVEALRQIALEHGRVPAKIGNVVLASPDLDVGVFLRQLEDMGAHRPQMTLFVAQTDRALGVSRLLAGGLTRLGAVDLTREDYKARLAGLSGVTVIDLSALQGGDAINHDLYAQSPQIVRLIGERLVQGQVITDSDVSFPSAAGETIGAAAGAVISAPIVLFEGAAGGR